MADAGELREFVAKAKQAGASDESLTAILKGKGWGEEETLAALCGYYEAAAGMAVPVRGGAGLEERSREGFLYLLSFSTLCVWAIAMGNILFVLIEHWLPDPVMARNYAYSSLRSYLTWPIASVMAALPAYLWVTRMLVVEVEGAPGRQSSGVRRWLTYLALFLAAATLVGDAIALLAGLLEGEVTARFLLKVLVVACIAGPIFVWHFRWLRREPSGVAALPAADRAWAMGVAAVCTVTLAAAIFLQGSPSKMREYTADSQRVRQLQGIARTLHDKHRVSAAALPAAGPLAGHPTDPETGVPYEYRLIEGTRYELCAVFAHPTQKPAAAVANLWDHPAGRHCYTLDAKEAPPYPQY